MSDANPIDVRAIQKQLASLEQKVDELTRLIKQIKQTVDHIQAYQK